MRRVGVNGYWYVEVEKQAFWRGNAHTWVNRYIMSGAQPGPTDAYSAADALKVIEDKLYPTTGSGHGVGFVEARAYGTGKGPAIATVPYNTSLDAASATGFSGDSRITTLQFGATLESCLVIETKLQGTSSTGKPIFLRKYIRGVYAGGEDGTATPINSSDLSVMTSNAAPWKTGVGPNSYVVIGSTGAQAQSAPAALPFIGNRQVPKGRKKKKTDASGLLSTIVSDTAKLRSLLSDAADF